jgi:hypothetical protein
MATLAESFLNDLDDLDEEPLAEDPLARAGAAGDAGGAVELATALARGVPTGSVDAVAPLMLSERFLRNIEACAWALRTRGRRLTQPPREWRLRFHEAIKRKHASGR